MENNSLINRRIWTQGLHRIQCQSFFLIVGAPKVWIFGIVSALLCSSALPHDGSLLAGGWVPGWEHLRESEFPCTSKEIQNCWHSIRSHNHSCNNMAKQWCLHSGRYFNVCAWPARRAGQVRRLKILPLSKHPCLAILLQLWLWLLIVCQ